MLKLKQLPDYHSIWNLREKNHTDVILTDDIEMHILEIPKIKKEEFESDELALWLKFIQNPVNKEAKENMKIEDIIDVTGLTKEEVEKLKNED